MKWNSEVDSDTAEHVLFSNRKPPKRVWVDTQVSVNPPCQFAHTLTLKDISPSCSLYCSFHVKHKWCQLAEGAVNGWLLSAKKEHFELFPIAPLW